MVLVLLVAALGLAAAVCTGGAGLADLRLRAVRLPLVAAVLQLAAAGLAPGSAALRLTAVVLTTALVGLFLVGNRRVAGAPLVGAGLLLNLTVVAANAGMPVDVGAAGRAGLRPAELGLEADALREPVGDATTLPWLGDVLPLALPWAPQLVSAGDVLVAAGVGLLLVSARGAQPPSRPTRSTVLDNESTTVGSYS